MSADPRLSHSARIVAELQERLSNACDGSDEDGCFLAHQLEMAAASLEDTLTYAARLNEEDQADANALKEIEAAKRERRQRLERRIEKRREHMAWAMQEAGLPQVKSPEFTISFRMGKPPLIIDGEPGEVDHQAGWATARTVYAWNKEVIRAHVEAGANGTPARLGNPQPTITIRGK